MNKQQMKNLAHKLHNLVGKQIMAIEHIEDLEDKSNPGIIIIFTEHEAFQLSTEVKNNKNTLII